MITYEYDVYGYDALGRLSQIQKDGKLQTRYGYDAFGNRVLKEDRTGRTAYRHNALNQLVSEIRQEGSGEAAFRKTYQYDKRGKTVRYEYNGLGHWTGKQEVSLAKEQLERLDPQSRIDE